jgi:hypothetical protein
MFQFIIYGILFPFCVGDAMSETPALSEFAVVGTPAF